MTDAVHVVVPSDVEPVLSVRGATKTFGAVVALEGVDLEVRAGEVLALLGDNGAGKRRPMPDQMGSRPSTKTWPCSTTSTRRRTSSPAAKWRGRPGCHAVCSG